MRWSFRDADGIVLTVPVSSRFMVNQAEPLLTAAVGGLGVILQPYEILAAALAQAVIHRAGSTSMATGPVCGRKRHATT